MIITHPYFQLSQMAVWGFQNMKRKQLIPANNHGPVTPEDRLHFYTHFINRILDGGE